MVRGYAQLRANTEGGAVEDGVELLGGRGALAVGTGRRMINDMYTPERHLPTPGQHGHSPQRHTAAGTAAPAPP